MVSLQEFLGESVSSKTTGKYSGWIDFEGKTIDEITEQLRNNKSVRTLDNMSGNLLTSLMGIHKYKSVVSSLKELSLDGMSVYAETQTLWIFCANKRFNRCSCYLIYSRTPGGYIESIRNISLPGGETKHYSGINLPVAFQNIQDTIEQ